jgi:TP901 family phage tail tape measure protein
VASVDTLTLRVLGDITDVTSKLKKLSGAVDGIGDTMQNAGDKITALGTKWSLAVTAPLVAVGKTALKTAATFEQTMNVMQSVTGATTEQMRAMSDQALQLGKDTIFGAGEAAEGMLELAKAGMSTEQVMAAIPGVLDLAAAGNVELAEAARLTAGVLNAFGLEAKESSRIANMLAAAANASSADIGDLALGMQQASAAFSASGQRAEDLTAALGILTNVGLKGSDAGTALKNAMMQLLGPTKKSRELMDELGISVFDAQGNMKPLRDIIAILNDKLGGLSQQERLAALDTIFLSDGMKAMVPLMAAGVEGFDAMLAAVTKDGAAKEVATARTKGLAGAIEYFQGTIESLMIEASAPWLEQLAAMVHGAADLIAKFGDLPAEVQKNIVIFAALAAAVGPVLVYFGIIVSSIGSLIKFATALLGPMGLAVAAVTAVGVAIVKNWGQLESIVMPAFQNLKQIVLDFVAGNMSAGDALIAIWNQLRDAGKQVFSVLIEYIRAQLPTWTEKLKEWGVAAWRWLAEIIPVVIDKLAEWGNALWQWILDHLPTWRARLLEWGNAAWQWLKDMTPIALEKLAEWGNALWQWILDNLPTWKARLLEWGNAAWQWIKDMTPIAIEKLQEWGRSIWQWILDHLPTWKARLLEWGQAAWQWIKDMTPIAIEKLEEWGRALWQWLIDKLPEWKARLAEWGRLAWQWIKDAMPIVMEKLGELWVQMDTWIQENVPQLKPWIDAFSNFIKGAKKDFDENFPLMAQRFTELRETIEREVPLIGEAVGRLLAALGIGVGEQGGMVGAVMKFVGIVAATVGTIITQVRILIDMIAIAAEMFKAFFAADWGRLDQLRNEWTQRSQEFDRTVAEQWRRFLDLINGRVAQIPPGGPGGGGTGAFASGGPVMRSGRYRVGEYGPETVMLPAGAYVDSGRGTTVHIINNWYGNPDQQAVANGTTTGLFRAGLRQVGLR